jgi:hypothetical protein
MPTTHKAYDICMRSSQSVTVDLAVISDVPLIKYVGSCITWELHSTGYFFETLSCSKNYPRWLPTAVSRVPFQVSSYGIGFPLSVLIPSAVPSPLIVLSSTLYSLDIDEVVKMANLTQKTTNIL